LRPKPGSSTFNSILLQRLQADRAIGHLKCFCIERIEKVSRNTLIYRIEGGSQRFVAKVQMTKPASVVAAEYNLLCELVKRLSTGGIRSLYPVALYPELGVLLTCEETGNSIRAYVDRGIHSKDGSEARTRAESLMEHAAYALYRFHTAFGIHKDKDGTELARRYLDYSPRNLLVVGSKEGEEIVLLDPPEFEEDGSIHLDLGTFCFDLARAGFMPGALLQLSQRWLDRLKWQFLSTYFDYLGRRLTATDLEVVCKSEQARAAKVLGWYARFFRYRSWPQEFARFLYFSPLVIWYRIFPIKRSYRLMRRELSTLTIDK